MFLLRLSLQQPLQSSTLYQFDVILYHFLPPRIILHSFKEPENSCFLLSAPHQNSALKSLHLWQRDTTELDGGSALHPPFHRGERPREGNQLPRIVQLLMKRQDLNSDLLMSKWALFLTYGVALY